MKNLICATFLVLGAFAHAETSQDIQNIQNLPAKLKCQQVTAVYGRYAEDRLRTVPTVSMDSMGVLFVSKGNLDNELVVTLNIDGEQITDLIFTSEDLAAMKSGKVNHIRGQYRESSSYHDSWVDALTVVDCVADSVVATPSR